MARQPLFALGHPSALGGGPPADRNHDCGTASRAHNHPKSGRTSLKGVPRRPKASGEYTGPGPSR